MPFSSENLLRQLDQEETITWALELKHGKESYDFLMRALGSEDLNVNQTINGLHALWKVRLHGCRAAVLQKFVEVAAHSNIIIRSEAIQLIIGLLKFTNSMEKIHLELSVEQDATVRRAIAGGLTLRTSFLARNYFLES